MTTDLRFHNAPDNQILAGTLARLVPHLTWRHSGLGMLQAYIHEGKTDELRVHIWHPSLRRPGIEESGLLHDHRFDLTSRVLVGTIRQVEFALKMDPHGNWQLHEVVHARAAADRHGSNDGLMTALPTRYSIEASATHIPAGRGYFFPKRVFHGTYVESGLAVTVVTKANQDDAPARILAPYGKPVVHAFADPLPEAAWQTPLTETVEALMKVWRGEK